MDLALFDFIENHPAPSLLVYIAIGCAQGRYPPGEHSPQEYPPFIRDFQIDHRVVLLIDPELEDPPRAIADNPATDTVTFIPIRAPLFWDRPVPPTHLLPIHGPTLVRSLLCLRRPPDYIVVQDYTGLDIAPYDPYIPGRVLFDATYGDYGCFIDFEKHVTIPRDPRTGAILHLDRLRLRDIPPEFSELTRRLARNRASDLRFYIHRHLRVLRNDTPAAEWCSPEEVARRATALSRIYGLPTAADNHIDLAALATRMLLDFGVPAIEIPALIADRTGEQLSKAISNRTPL